MRLILSILLASSLVTVSTAQNSVRDTLKGFTGAYRDIRVGSVSSSRVVQVYAEEGKRVQVGNPLVQLDDTVVKAAVEVARHAAKATGDLRVAELMQKSRNRNLERVQELFTRKRSTVQELWNAKLSLQEANARLKSQQESSERRQAELQRVELEWKEMMINAPIDGIVVEVLKDVGEIVSPADPHLIRMVQLDPLKITVADSIDKVSRLRVGMELRVTVETMEGVATIDFISPIADPVSGNSVIHLRLPNPDLAIPCGVPCQIHLDTNTPDPKMPGNRVKPVFQTRAPVRIHYNH